MISSRITEAADLNIEKLIHLIEPILNEMNFELVDIEYLSERGKWILRIYADKDEGMTLDDCVYLSREIGDLIDVKDIISHEYVLEVSSPGLNRPLRREKDFLRAIGNKVKIKMSVPIKGRRRFTGYLRKFEKGILYIEVDNDLTALFLKDVEKANLIYEFGN